MSEIGGLHKLNTAQRADALRMLEPIVERSGWVAQIAVDERPFASSQALARSLIEVILKSGFDKRIQLFRAHPELAGREAIEGKMTDASKDEQGRLGLTTLSKEESARLFRLNTEYAERFGHPFILALHRVPNLQAVLETFERRLQASEIEEHVSTLAEIASVIAHRADRAFAAPADAASRQYSGGERIRSSEAHNV